MPKSGASSHRFVGDRFVLNSLAEGMSDLWRRFFSAIRMDTYVWGKGVHLSELDLSSGLVKSLLPVLGFLVQETLLDNLGQTFDQSLRLYIEIDGQHGCES